MRAPGRIRLFDRDPFPFDAGVANRQQHNRD
jgi:hypothetical protein